MTGFSTAAYIRAFDLAFVVQTLLPLLIIALGYGLLADERERGLDRILAVQQVAPGWLLAGRLLPSEPGAAVERGPRRAGRRFAATRRPLRLGGAADPGLRRVLVGAGGLDRHLEAARRPDPAGIAGRVGAAGAGDPGAGRPAVARRASPAVALRADRDGTQTGNRGRTAQRCSANTPTSTPISIPPRTPTCRSGRGTRS
ncbi:ABC transporter permease [Luteimonas suaedae]|uniref:ABC transporter permease n=1 Tax=Luteimonas suaedae TaxID=2605430 RepID=UPI0011ED74DC|nr:ABC transporter permease [Luteimonas suaedae]